MLRFWGTRGDLTWSVAGGSREAASGIMTMTTSGRAADSEIKGCTLWRWRWSDGDDDMWAAAEIVVGVGSNRRSHVACGVTTSNTAANGKIKRCIAWSWSGEDADMWAAAGIVADGAACIFTLAAATVVVVHHATRRRQQQHEPVYSLV